MEDFSATVTKVSFLGFQISGRGNRLTTCVAPRGSIIHPSVYFLMYTYRVSVRNAPCWSKDDLKNLAGFRKSKLPVLKADPWEVDPGMAELSACRILVCGETGAGKSTLLNCVFGIRVVRM